jgi:DNA mismatch repair protein MSH4
MRVALSPRSVPAQEASFPPLDRVLSRLSNGDEPEANLSSFASEMKTMALILDMATKKSLVLIDELGVSQDNC